MDNNGWHNIGTEVAHGEVIKMAEKYIEYCGGLKPIVIPRGSKLRDAIYGLAVADALGVPVEFLKRGTYEVKEMVGYGSHMQHPGTWSDDTSMTLATCDSIRECGDVNPSDIYEKFRAWLFEAKYTPDDVVFDVGQTTSRAIRNGEGLSEVWANGNGSLMRIIPLAFTDADNELIGEVSAITHAHGISKLACMIYVYIARKLLKGEDLESILETIEADAPFDRLKGIKALSIDEIKSSGYVVDTLEAALWCLATTDNYKDAVLKAVNLGMDTDTVAAVTGGLAGILYGFDAIPKEWIETLRGKDVIESCLF